jgi:serine protease Do
LIARELNVHKSAGKALHLTPQIALALAFFIGGWLLGALAVAQDGPATTTLPDTKLQESKLQESDKQVKSETKPISDKSTDKALVSVEIEKVAEERLRELLEGKPPKSIAELKAIQDHVKLLIPQVMPAVVAVTIDQAQGTGVIINDKGYIMTAAHVAGTPNKSAEVILPDGRRVKGRTLGLFRTVDAGLMKITESSPTPWPFVETADSDKIKEGQWCMVLGHPGGYQADRKPVLRLGRVLHHEDSAITTDCTLVGGDSGGPLLDMNGRVIGINSRIAEKITSNIHVPVNAYRTHWERLATSEAWGHFPGQRPYIGLRGEKGLEKCRVTRVVENSPAQKAGIVEGDVITKFDEHSVTDFASLMKLVDDKQPGDEVRITLQRAEQILELSLRIKNASDR